jgi:hypothetical protein
MSQKKSIRGFKRPSFRPTEIDAKPVEVDGKELRGSFFLGLLRVIALKERLP